MATEQRGLGTGDWGLGSDRRAPDGRYRSDTSSETPSYALGASALSRRGFLGTAAASIAALMIPKSAESLVPSPRSLLDSPQPIGLQLYTVRDLMQKDVEGTLRQVAGVGYREVEFAGLFDKKATTVAKWLREDKLTSPSSHIPINRLRENIQGVVDECRTLGNSFIVCPYLDEKERGKTADDWRKLAGEFNKFGDQVKRAGMQFAYHNHDFEFVKLPSGEMGYDILCKECDPKNVKLELDLYWITKAGQDPLAYFAKYPGRFPCVHVKDMTGTGQITNVGEGRIDWSRIFAKRREAGIEHFFVERDNPTNPIADITVSYAYLAKLGL
jgi:sugar phosphate isomerase/epimerase